MKKQILATVLGATLCAGAMAAPLNVGTEATFAPFEFMDEEKREITGFDIDMIKAIAKAAGHEVKIQNMGFDGLIPSLQTNVIDAVAAAMTITPARQKAVQFTEPYYQSGLVVLINKKDDGKIKEVASLEGKRICAQIGTTGAMMAKRIKDSKVTLFNSITEAFMDLKSGGCDAVLNDKPVVEFYLARRGDDSVKILPQVLEAEYYGFAVNKRNKALAEKLNKGLQTIKANGEYDKIYQKWFGAAK